MAKKLFYHTSTMSLSLLNGDNTSVNPIVPNNDDEWELVSAITFTEGGDYYRPAIKGVIWYWKCEQ